MGHEEIAYVPVSPVSPVSWLPQVIGHSISKNDLSLLIS
jgi:hypothetical protein